MFLVHKPSDVREEDSPLTVVWISICVRVLVVHPVIAAPDEETILTSDTLTDGQKDTEWKLCLVRPVRPQPVGTACHPESRPNGEKDGCFILWLDA